MINKIARLICPPLVLSLFLKFLPMVGFSRKFNSGNFGEITPDNFYFFPKKSYIDFYKFYKKTVDENFFQKWILSRVQPNEDILPLLLCRTNDISLERRNFFSALDESELSKAWILFLEQGKFDIDALGEYYNSKQVIAFTFAKLRDDRWLTSRLLPLLLIEDLGSKAYLEDGGADGLLPFFASIVCKQSINIELNDLQRDFSRELAGNCGLINFSAFKSLELIEDESVDIISSHQLLEHLESPEGQLSLYKKKLKNSGFIICSTGFNLHPWPGHLPSAIPYAGKEKFLFESCGFIPYAYNDLCFAFLGVMIYQKVT